MRVVVPCRRPGVTATSCEPCHCAAGVALAISLVEPESPLGADEPLLADGCDEDGVEADDGLDAPGVLFFIDGPVGDAASAEYCASTRPDSPAIVVDVGVCAMVSCERSLVAFSPPPLWPPR